MSTQNTQPDTKDLLQPAEKTSDLTESRPKIQSVKKSQMFTNTDNPSNNVVVSNVSKSLNNIFGNSSRKSQNIFGQNNTQKTVNLFNISTVPQTSNIFKTASKPLVVAQHDEDQKSESNASSEGVRKAQSEFKSLPEKLEMKFKYENEWSVIKTFNLKKFKNGGNSSKEHIYMTIERNKDYADKVYLIVRAKETRVVLFQGFGLKNVTDKVSPFMNREDNLKFSVVKQVKREEGEGEAKQQFAKEELKVQFCSLEEANEFRDFIVSEFGDKNQEQQNKKPEEQIQN